MGKTIAPIDYIRGSVIFEVWENGYKKGVYSLPEKLYKKLKNGQL